MADPTKLQRIILDEAESVANVLRRMEAKRWVERLGRSINNSWCWRIREAGRVARAMPTELVDNPPPYICLYLARRQAEHVHRIVAKACENRTQSHPLHAALRHLDEALARRPQPPASSGVARPHKEPG